MKLTKTEEKAILAKARIDFFHKYAPYCQLCGIAHMPEDLDLHHKIRRWKAGPHKNDASNLIMLCRACHMIIHANRKKENLVKDSQANVFNGRQVLNYYF